MISLGWRFETLQKKSQNRGHEETFQKKSTFIRRMKKSLYFDDFTTKTFVTPRPKIHYISFLVTPGFWDFFRLLDLQPREINLNLIVFFSYGSAGLKIHRLIKKSPGSILCKKRQFSNKKLHHKDFYKIRFSYMMRSSKEPLSSTLFLQTPWSFFLLQNQPHRVIFMKLWIVVVT